MTTTPEKAERELDKASAVADVEEYEERHINLGGKNSAAMKPGERIIICTPGGGGWGKSEDRKDGPQMQNSDPRHAWTGGSHAAREEAALQA